VNNASTYGNRSEDQELARYVATDTDRVTALDCDVCRNDSGFTCEVTGLNTTRATLAIRGRAPNASGAFTCNATDAHAAVSTAATVIVARSIAPEIDLAVPTEPATPEPSGARDEGGADNDDDDHALSAAVVAGILLGALAVATLAGGLVYLVLVRRRRRRAQPLALDAAADDAPEPRGERSAAMSPDSSPERRVRTAVDVDDGATSDGSEREERFDAI